MQEKSTEQHIDKLREMIDWNKIIAEETHDTLSRIDALLKRRGKSDAEQNDKSAQS